MPGPAIEIEGIPKAVPLATAVNLLRTLTRAHGAGKLSLSDGDTISPTGKWALHVFQMTADATFPNGRIVLSFYKNRIASAPLVTDPGLQTAETTPQDTADGLAAKALASLRAAKRQSAPVETPLVQRAAATPRLSPDLKPVSVTAAPEPARERPADAQTAQPDKAVDVPTETTDARDGKVSLLGWMVQQCKTLPRENRARSASLAVVIALSTLANPYADFTGGVDTRSAPLAHNTAALEPQADTALFAALLTD